MEDNLIISLPIYLLDCRQFSFDTSQFCNVLGVYSLNHIYHEHVKKWT